MVNAVNGFKEIYKIGPSEEGTEIKIKNLSPYKLTYTSIENVFNLAYLNYSDAIESGETGTINFRKGDYNLYSFFSVGYCFKGSELNLRISYSNTEEDSSPIIWLESAYNGDLEKKVQVKFDERRTTLTLKPTVIAVNGFDRKYEIKFFNIDCRINIENQTPYELKLVKHRSVLNPTEPEINVKIVPYESIAINIPNFSFYLSDSFLWKGSARLGDNIIPFEIFYSKRENSNIATIWLESDFKDFRIKTEIIFNEESATLTFKSKKLISSFGKDYGNNIVIPVNGFDKEIEFPKHEQINIRNLTPHKLSLDASLSTNMRVFSPKHRYTYIEPSHTKAIKFQRFDPNLPSTFQLDYLFENYDRKMSFFNFLTFSKVADNKIPMSLKIFYSRPAEADDAFIQIECDSVFTEKNKIKFNEASATLTFISEKIVPPFGKYFPNNIVIPVSGSYNKYEIEFSKHEQIKIRNLTPYKLSFNSFFTTNMRVSSPKHRLNYIEPSHTEAIKFERFYPNRPSTFQLDYLFENYDKMSYSNFSTFPKVADNKIPMSLKIFYSRPAEADNAMIKLDYDAVFEEKNQLVFNKESAVLTLMSIEEKNFNERFEIKTLDNECIINLTIKTPFKLNCFSQKMESPYESTKEHDFHILKMIISIESYNEYDTFDMHCTIDNKKYQTLDLDFQKSGLNNKCYVHLKSFEDFEEEIRIAYNEKSSTFFLIPKNLN